MSESQPPSELLPIFNPANYPDAQPTGIGGGGGGGSYLSFPTAQGIETFPGGVVFGDGSYMNTADTPLQDTTQLGPYVGGPLPLSWPYGGGTSYQSVGGSSDAANYAWYVVYCSGSMAQGYPSSVSVSLGYYVDQFTDLTNPYRMVTSAIKPGSYDIELTAFTSYNTYGFAILDSSADGKYVAVLPARDGINHVDNYPMGIITKDYGTSVVLDTNIGALPNAPSGNPRAYFPQTIQVSASGQYITTCQLQYVSGGLDAVSPLDLHQSTDYGATYSRLLRVDNVLNDFSTATPNLKIQAPHAQSKTGRVICVAYNLGYESIPGIPSGQSEGMSVSISTDFGRTFTETLNIVNYGTFTRWPVPTCMAMSANGQYIYIGYMNDDSISGQTGGGLVYSDDFGATWQNAKVTTVNTTPYVFTDLVSRVAYVRCSASGLKVICSDCSTASSSKTFYFGTQGAGAMTTAGNKSFFNFFMDGEGYTLLGVQNGPATTDGHTTAENLLNLYYF